RAHPEIVRPAFASAEESLGFLPHGRGWTECFVYEPGTYEAMRDLIFRGLVNGDRIQARRAHHSGVGAVERPVAAVHGPAAPGAAGADEADGAGAVAPA